MHNLQILKKDVNVSAVLLILKSVFLKQESSKYFKYI